MRIRLARVAAVVIASAGLAISLAACDAPGATKLDNTVCRTLVCTTVTPTAPAGK